MLDAVAQLAENAHGQVGRRLGDEVHADALGAYKAHNLVDLFQQRFAAVAEQKMRFVKEEDHPGLVQIAHFRQTLVDFAEHPEHEGGIHGGIAEKTVCSQYVDRAAPGFILGEPVFDLQGRFAEETVAALIFQNGNGSLDGTDGRGGDIAVLERITGAVFAGVLQNGFQVPDIQEQHAFIIGNVENDVKNAGLGFIQAEHAPEKNRTHFRDGGAHRVSLFTVQIPERDGILGKRKGGNAAFAQTGRNLFIVAS